MVIKAADEFKHKTSAPNQIWQADFTYFKIVGWGWYYLSTILDDFSRYIVAWKLCATMRADDVTATLDLALASAGLDHAAVVHRPRLLPDNGASYISEDLAKWLEKKRMRHVRGAPYHPQTQGKIERWHQTPDHRQSTLAASAARRLNLKPDEPETPIQKRSAVSNQLTTDRRQRGVTHSHRNGLP